MKKILLITLSIVLLNQFLTAQQSIDAILVEVEKNNTSLIAFRKNIDALMIGNKTDIYLQNPEIEFNYLWGNPAISGNRTDFKISQSFDFPTSYAYRSQISNLKNDQLLLEYNSFRNKIIFEVNTLCIELVYLNSLQSKLMERIEFAQRIADLYQIKFDAGEASILDFNKAQINLFNLKQELQALTTTRNQTLSELIAYNGGQELDFRETDFPDVQVSNDFEAWFILAKQSNPQLNWLTTSLEITKSQVDLNKSLALPGFVVGYMNESVVGQKYSGLTFGVTIPLVQNKNKVKFEQQNYYALESKVVDHELQLYSYLQSLYTKAVELDEIRRVYSAAMKQYDNSEFLNTALESGEISLIEYILEQSYYYENYTKLLEIERELSRTITELNQYN